MTTRRFAALALLLAALGAAAPLDAQDDRRGIREVSLHQRQGFWFGAGLAAGGDAVSLDGDPAGFSDQIWRPAFALRLGGTTSEHLRLGAEYYSWWRRQSGPDAVYDIVSSLNFIGQYYPGRRSGLFVKGGLGLGLNSFSSSLFGFGTGTSNTGFATQLGAGWEVPLGRRSYLVPQVEVVNHWYGQDAFGGPGYQRRQLVIGISYVAQTGR